MKPLPFDPEACPDDADRKKELEGRLADAHISAIWFPEGEFQQIKQMLARAKMCGEISMEILLCQVAERR